MTEKISLSKTVTEYVYSYQEASRLKKKLERKGIKNIRISKNIVTNFDTTKSHKEWKIEYTEVIK